MSTRAMIARRKGDGFEGVYHHFDGYPTGLGAFLWARVHEIEPEAMLHFLIDEHPGGWSTIDGDWSMAPGYSNTDKHPCATCGRPMPDHYRQYDPNPSIIDQAEIARGNYMRFDHPYTRPNIATGPQCYCHGDRSETEGTMTNETADWLSIEWAYVFDAEARTLAVIKGIPTPETQTETRHDGTEYEARKYRYTLVIVVSLDGPEPIWETVEDLGHEASERAYATCDAAELAQATI